MKRTSVVAVTICGLVAVALLAMVARGYAQSVDADENGCWLPDYDCVSVDADWKGDHFYSYYTNNCPARIVIRVCHGSTHGNATDCVIETLRPGVTFDKSTLDVFEPTGQYGYAYVGSTGRDDWACANKAGVTHYKPSWAR